MSIDTFVAFLSSTMDKLSGQLMADKGSLLFGQRKTASCSAYDIPTQITGYEFYVGLSEEMAKVWLMRTAADVVANYLRKFDGDLEQDGRWFLRQEAIAPHDEESLADELLMRIYQHILLKFEKVLGLNFDAINALSLRPYESEQAKGILCFIPYLMPHEVPSLQERLCVAFRAPFPVFSSDNVKHIRKLLAGAGKEEENGLLFAWESGTQDYTCRGYLGQKDIYDTPYHIQIRGPAKWLLYKGRQILFCVESERPKLWHDPLLGAMDVLRGEFSLSEENEYVAERLLRVFAKQRHGTSVIFINRKPVAGVWANWLVARKRSISVERLDINKEGVADSLLGLSRMDGAFIVNVSDWTITNIATIVDGIAYIDGDPSRGARHNSLTTALANLCKKDKKVRAVAVIISEDGDMSAIRASNMRLRLKEAVKPYHVKKSGNGGATQRAKTLAHRVLVKN